MIRLTYLYNLLHVSFIAVGRAVSDKNKFSYLNWKHKVWVLVRTPSLRWVLTNTNKLCVEQKEENVYPCTSHISLNQVRYRGFFLHGTCKLDVKAASQHFDLSI